MANKHIYTHSTSCAIRKMQNKPQGETTIYPPNN